MPFCLKCDTEVPGGDFNNHDCDPGPDLTDDEIRTALDNLGVIDSAASGEADKNETTSTDGGSQLRGRLGDRAGIGVADYRRLIDPVLPKTLTGYLVIALLAVTAITAALAKYRGAALTPITSQPAYVGGGLFVVSIVVIAVAIRGVLDPDAGFTIR